MSETVVKKSVMICQGNLDNQDQFMVCGCRIKANESTQIATEGNNDKCENLHTPLNWKTHIDSSQYQCRKADFTYIFFAGKWKFSEILVLVFILLSISGISSANNFCGRKIVTGAQGTILDGPGFYPRRRSCEWLIKGKTNMGLLRVMSCQILSLASACLNSCLS